MLFPLLNDRILQPSVRCDFMGFILMSEFPLKTGDDLAFMFSEILQQQVKVELELVRGPLQE